MGAPLRSAHHDFYLTTDQAGERDAAIAAADHAAYLRWCDERKDADLLQSFADWATRSPEAFAAWEAHDKQHNWKGGR